MSESIDPISDSFPCAGPVPVQCDEAIRGVRTEGRFAGERRDLSLTETDGTNTGTVRPRFYVSNNKPITVIGSTPSSLPMKLTDDNAMYRVVVASINRRVTQVVSGGSRISQTARRRANS